MGSRRIAPAASVEVNIEKISDNVFRKHVVSSFYTTDEKMVIDEKWHQVDKLKKRHSIIREENGAVVLKTDIQGKTHQWTERIQINTSGTEMRNTYLWKSSNGGTGTASHVFGLFSRFNALLYANKKGKRYYYCHRLRRRVPNPFNNSLIDSICRSAASVRNKVAVSTEERTTAPVRRMSGNGPHKHQNSTCI